MIMPTIEAHHGYEILNCPLDQAWFGNHLGRCFGYGFSASEIVRFDCHRAVLGLLGHLRGPSIGEQEGAFCSLERGLIVARSAQTGTAPQRGGHCDRASAGLVRDPNAWSIASRLRKVSGHGREFRMGDVVFECRTNFAIL